jgi:hypothetical protein
MLIGWSVSRCLVRRTVSSQWRIRIRNIVGALVPWFGYFEPALRLSLSFCITRDDLTYDN